MILRKIFEEITMLGGILFYLLVIILFFLIKKQVIYLSLIFSLAIIYLTTLIIRLFYYKPRPKRIPYRNLLEKIDSSSFPSIHAARATTLFIIISLSFVLKIPIIILFFITVLLVLYSRINLKKHDPIDITAGVLLGIISSGIALII